MRCGMRAMLLSAAAHALILGGGVAASKYMERPSPAVPIDVTQFTDGGGGGGEGSDAMASGEETMPVLPPSVTPVPAAKVDAVSQQEMPSVLSDSAEAAPIAASPAAAPAPQPASGNAVHGGTGGGNGHGGGVGSGRGTGMGSGSGSGQGGGSGNGHGDGLDVLRAIYLREHFAYIRDRIAKHLIYPSVAIRAGLSGKVLVSFVILEDGRVNDLHVVRSSGISLLDRDAKETVMRSIPFPRPPVSARIVIPVEYLLQ